MIGFGSGNPTVDYTNFQSVTVTKPASSACGHAGQLSMRLKASPSTISSSPPSPRADIGNAASDFVATIDWGDGTPRRPARSRTSAPTATKCWAATLTPWPATYGQRHAHRSGSMGSTTVGGTLFTVTSTGPVNSNPNPIVSSACVATPP